MGLVPPPPPKPREPSIQVFPRPRPGQILVHDDRLEVVIVPPALAVRCDYCGSRYPVNPGQCDGCGARAMTPTIDGRPATAPRPSDFVMLKR